MPLLFKMQKTLGTFSLTLIVKIKILDIPKLLRNMKVSQNVWGMWIDWKNKNSHVNCLITYMFMGLEHEKKDKVQVLQQN